MRSGRLRRLSEAGDDDREPRASQSQRSRGRSSQDSGGRRPAASKRRRVAAAGSSDDDDNDREPTLTQIDNDADGGGDDVSARDGEVADVMRFIMHKNASHEPCRAADISKFVLAKHRNHQPVGRVLEAAAIRFKNDMGYELVLIDAIDARGDVVPQQQQPVEEAEGDDDDDDGQRERAAARKKKEKRPNLKKVYILRNAIDRQKWVERINSKDDTFNPYRGLLLAVYGFLYIRKGSTNESDLFDFLVKLGLQGSVKHPIFGDIRNQIVEFTKQQFLHRRKVDSIDDNIHVYEYQIGPRGLKLISRSDIRDFVSAIMGVELPDSEADDDE